MRDTLEIMVYESFIVVNDTPKHRKSVLSTEFFGVNIMDLPSQEILMGVNRFGRELVVFDSITTKPSVA